MRDGSETAATTSWSCQPWVWVSSWDSSRPCQSPRLLRFHQLTGVTNQVAYPRVVGAFCERPLGRPPVFGGTAFYADTPHARVAARAGCLQYLTFARRCKEQFSTTVVIR